jgi:hypothetical protein
VRNKCLRPLQELIWDNLNESGPTEEANGEVLKDIIRELVIVMHAIKPNASFLLHVDDVQVMSPDIDIDFERAHPNQIIPKNKFCNYYLIFLNQALFDLRGSSGFIKVAITGTNVFQDRMIHLGIEVLYIFGSEFLFNLQTVEVSYDRLGPDSF